MQETMPNINLISNLDFGIAIERFFDFSKIHNLVIYSKDKKIIENYYSQISNLKNNSDQYVLLGKNGKSNNMLMEYSNKIIDKRYKSEESMFDKTLLIFYNNFSLDVKKILTIGPGVGIHILEITNSRKILERCLPYSYVINLDLK